MRFGRIFFILVFLVCVFEMMRLWAVSPEQMAAHFNALGEPDRFTSRLEFFGFQIRTLAVATGLGLLVQVLMKILPLEWINLPNRSYWLAAEHRDATLDRLSSFAAMLFGIILLVILAGFELAVSANLHQPVIFQAQVMVPIIVGFIIVSLVMLFWLARSFQILQEKDQARGVS